MRPALGVSGRLKKILDRLTNSTEALSDGRVAKLDNLDAAVSTRAPASTALSSATWTGAKAAFLDAAISTAGRQLKKQIYTSGSGSWPVPTGVHVVYITACGGGGGGGASPTGSTADCGGSGGAGAACCLRLPVHVVPGASVAYAVGALGTGGVAGSNPGTAGGNTTFGNVTLTGGSGGAYGASSQTPADTSAPSVFASLTAPWAFGGGIGGRGGGSTGDANPGGDVYGYMGGTAGAAYDGGGGGASAFGPGGNGALGDGTTGADGSAPASGYGGGGGGAGHGNVNKAGGNGAAGILILEWWEP